MAASEAPPVSARDASYWFAVASTPSSSRSNSIQSLSTSSTRSLASHSFLATLDVTPSSSSSSSRSTNKPVAVGGVQGGPNVPEEEEEESPAPLPSLYGRAFPNVPRPPSVHHPPPPRHLVVAEQVYEHQRYQLLMGWGSKGHLLPLDPEKYVRLVVRPRSMQATDDDDDVTLAWSSSWTFPTDISLPAPPSFEHEATAAVGPRRTKSATRSNDVGHAMARASETSTGTVSCQWEWISPWHLDVPLETDASSDGWHYASSFSHFYPRPSMRQRGKSIDLMSPSPELLSTSPTTSAGKRLRVRRRKWVRYRRLRTVPRTGGTDGTSSSAFDDAFLDSMSGWLRKRGHVRKNWKLRYFVLHKSVLRYYTDASCSKLKGEVLLFHPKTRVHYVDVHVANGRDASFAIQVGPEYTLLLQAMQLRDRENWMYCIEEALLCRDSYCSQGRIDKAGPYFDLRESVAHRRMLSAEAMALGSSFRDEWGNISHAHGDAACVDDVDDDDDALHGRTSRHRGDRLCLWASLHAKPGGVLSAVSSASATMRALLRACDQFLASRTMQHHIRTFLTTFRRKYEQSTTSLYASGWIRRSEPCAPSGYFEVEKEEAGRASACSATSTETVTTLQDARSLLALKNYRFFLERSLEMIMTHLSNVANARTSQELEQEALNSQRAPTDDEWALVRRAALYKLERRTFIPLQEVIYQLLEAGSTSGRSLRVEEEERFERLRALVASKSQRFLEIRPSHQSSSEWQSAIALLDSMDNYSLPSEKAAVLVEVARCIYETHAKEHGVKDEKSVMAADDFLPIFIFILARCHLRSVIVARHLISETMITALMIGETGYYATMLEAAIGYIAAFDWKTPNKREDVGDDG
ncbi:hypothetical protein PsorP6_010603 [Peronosclerospora sorghi]|uniref:Uncharacterized protein n=1 Tax=Peronosclerospora sorghi TaxID=230839 RepID=A0ACC0VTS2_9STRA|nr:hypothetical protein PsorP6_010603 [Peronosclerospora sorghi]